MIKNPVNPMFSGMAVKYEQFRARIKVWIPTLQTLDGTDFSKDMATINAKKNEYESEKVRMFK